MVKVASSAKFTSHPILQRNLPKWRVGGIFALKKEKKKLLFF